MKQKIINIKKKHWVILSVILLMLIAIIAFLLLRNEEENTEEVTNLGFGDSGEVEVETVDSIENLFLNEQELPDGYIIADLGKDIGEFAKENGQYKFKKAQLCSESSWEGHEACTYFSESYVQFILNEEIGSSIAVIYGTINEGELGEELEQTAIDGRKRDDSFGLTCIPGGKARSEDYEIFITVDIQEGEDKTSATQLFDTLIQKGNLISIVECR